MTDLQTKNFNTLVSEQVATIQGGASALVDFTIGSILRAIVEAYAAVALWLQGLILQVLALTRAATSSGSDLDSWVADFGLTRLPAAFASGQVTFSRFTSTLQAVVPIGAIVQTADGSQQYAVTVDTTNAAYSASQGGYVIPAGTPSVIVPVQALTAGTGANAAAGGINTLGQAIAGVDTVSNASPFENGQNAESDAALRTRFINYLASLSKATKAAVGYAISSVQTGLTYQLVENENFDGTAHIGFFYVVIDDGSGDPSDALVAAVYAAIDAVRPVSVNFAVFKPTVETANVVMTVKLAAGYDIYTTPALVQAAITNFIDSQPLGTTLAWSRLIQIAYDASPGVIGVSNYTLNGGTSDLTASANQVIKSGTITVAGTF
jgi:uncharacterized phage protein gp47/JayE